MTGMDTIATYREAEEYILSIPRFTKKNSISDTRQFYEFLGKPGKDRKIIHVAGTNGKGSVCAYMEACLRQAGIEAGLFTSPHLVSMRERIRIGEKKIEESEFVACFQRLAARLKEYGSDYHPTFFEWIFFHAMLYFEEKKVPVILLETGLGGRLDATNAIDAPAVCVLTRIGLDHCEYLGDTLESIAEEKAGIIKKGSVVVFGEMEHKAECVIYRKIAELGCLFRKVADSEDGFPELQDKGIDFSFFSRYYDYIPLTARTRAVYQPYNIRLALAALEEAGFCLAPEQMREGVLAARWEGRMEEIRPGVCLDGAHNRDGIEAFLESVKRDGCKGRRFLLFSTVADKQYESISEQILSAELFEKIGVVPLRNPRGLGKEELKALFGEKLDCVFDSVKEAMDCFLKRKKEDDRLYIAGSLYLVGEVKEYL